MPRGDKNPYKGDLKKLNTSGTARRTTQESLDAARTRAAGAPAPPPNPELQAWAKGEIEDRIKRTVMGTVENKGRSPMITLSHIQHAQFKETGEWEGMPTLEEYGPQHAAREDKEYETEW
jgi:hypothetical protein